MMPCVLPQKGCFMEVVYIHWWRQVKRYLHSRSSILSSIMQPILYLLSLGFGLGPTFQNAGQGNYLQFLTPGVVGMIILFAAVFSGIDLISDRQFGFLRATLVAPVPRTAIMLGRTLGGATVAFIQGVLVLIACYAVGFRAISGAGVVKALLLMALVAILFAALGTAVASLLENFQGFQTFTNFMAMPLFFFSGALFPLTNISKGMMFIARINPFAYGVDGLRVALLQWTTPFGIYLDLLVVAAIAVILIPVGAYLFSRIQM
jgi:ABC-2 type transport system permease protein